MMYGLHLARASQRPEVRQFAKDAEAFLEGVDAELVTRGRGHSSTPRFGPYRIEPGTASVEVLKTRRSRVSWVTATVRLSENGEISGACECTESQAICEHIAAALIGLIPPIESDDQILMRLKGMTAAQIEAVEEARKPGRTRWAAGTYIDGPSPAEALTRTPGPLPEPPRAPEEPEAPGLGAGLYGTGYLTADIDTRQLGLQASIAAQAARAVLDSIEHGRPLHQRPDDLHLDAARVAAAAAETIPELAQITGFSLPDMEDRARAWDWAGAEGVAVLTEQWQPNAAVCAGAHAQLAATYGEVERHQNRWTIPGRGLQLRLSREGRWHPYVNAPSGWSPSGPPESELQTVIAATGR